jgi:hypothetical protein
MGRGKKHTVEQVVNAGSRRCSSMRGVYAEGRFRSLSSRVMAAAFQPHGESLIADLLACSAITLLADG